MKKLPTILFLLFLVTFKMGLCQYMDAKDTYFLLRDRGFEDTGKRTYFNFLLNCRVDTSLMTRAFCFLSQSDEFLSKYGLESFKNDFFDYDYSDGDWILMAETDDHQIEWWINTERLYAEKERMFVWEKTVYYNTERAEMINLLSDPREKNWFLFKYSLSYNEYDLTKSKVRTLTCTYYSKYGKPISSRDYNDPDWNYILPDSYGDKIFNSAKNKLIPK